MVNKKRAFYFATVLLLVLTSITGLYASDLPQRPNPPTLVTDFANVFTPEQESALERKLVDFFASTSTQIAVVSVQQTAGYDISDYAFRLGEEWGIGDQQFNNGILILIKPKTGTSQGRVFIAVGYGLEAVITDATSKIIIDNEMIPQFKANKYYAGVDKATNVIIDLSKGEYTEQQYAKSVGSGGFNPFLIFILIFFVFPLIFGRKRRTYYSAGNRSNLPLWIALGMFGGSQRNHGGFYNGFSGGSGSGSGGGSSFGSFGGFGGGSFGGGGAGGSW